VACVPSTGVAERLPREIVALIAPTGRQNHPVQLRDRHLRPLPHHHMQSPIVAGCGSTAWRAPRHRPRAGPHFQNIRLFPGMSASRTSCSADTAGSPPACSVPSCRTRRPAARSRRPCAQLRPAGTGGLAPLPMTGRQSPTEPSAAWRSPAPWRRAVPAPARRAGRRHEPQETGEWTS